MKEINYTTTKYEIYQKYIQHYKIPFYNKENLIQKYNI